jgi:hypothetical protein
MRPVSPTSQTKGKEGSRVKQQRHSNMGLKTLCNFSELICFMMKKIDALHLLAALPSPQPPFFNSEETLCVTRCTHGKVEK